ncbi:hypothetical protein PUNSTDRAFT_129688 [Punctularia strigosozonata HHB-11173 SS5]|uniref:uncharacterized protein n=1 Tax=Punctularia strigosozonata (strain HHB-11173) TaxID=741275 RepID=UPI0004418525|nr:uncharacterized protein PUNSTDRAFT_129688 [Punctularia strigosozonata HHB-11173 SS5]EIN14038.1 hypothetical protein PUNSTDRAFT_129688 [Punctularia strigosozonata HHB-11173 SS5]
MSTKKRPGVSTATSEAARRQLMQPVLCWERRWVKADQAAPGSNMKVYKWVRTEKTQQFSDDEGDVDEPLAPLPDEPETVEVDEELEEVEGTAPPPSALATDTAAPTPITKSAEPSKPPSPTPRPSEMDIEIATPAEQLDVSLDPEVLEQSLNPPDALDEALAPPGDEYGATSTLDDSLSSVVEGLNPDDLSNVDLSALPPDGMAFEGAHDLTRIEQIEPTDAILGGSMMDQSGDPFAEPRA